MKLQKISINNFRSIQSLELVIERVNLSQTFCLLGINESGKSSFLKALALFDQDDVTYPLDFHDENNPIIISLLYTITSEEIKEIKDFFVSDLEADKHLMSQIDILDVCIEAKFPPETGSRSEISEKIRFKRSFFENYTLLDDRIVKRDLTDEENESLDLNKYFQENFSDYFWKLSHNITFWKSSSEFLITDEIDLTQFAADPKSVSVPLKNCFDLAKIENIQKSISKLSSPVSIQNLEERLSEKITSHINKIWPEHPIKIKFKINNNKLSFLIEDKGVKFKNKTTNQRSDGFRQLISFLLTLSAENYSEELSNTILLLDEPETHLHPTAQLNLKNELIKLSENYNNNIVFFATHSNYMIDKENLERCYKVYKEKNQKTKLERIIKHNSSYSEINYEAFDIATNDYHNELYGFLEDTNKPKLNSLPKIRKWKNEKTHQIDEVSLATYIRHSIHHPENKSNPRFTEKELRESIESLRKIKYANK